MDSRAKQIVSLLQVFIEPRPAFVARTQELDDGYQLTRLIDDPNIALHERVGIDNQLDWGLKDNSARSFRWICRRGRENACAPCRRPYFSARNRRVSAMKAVCASSQ